MSGKIVYMLFFLLFVGTLAKAQTESFEIILSNPNLPATLEFSDLHTGVEILGYDGETIKIEVSRKNKRIILNEYPITYVEDQNKVTLTKINQQKGYTFKIHVPYNTKLDIRVEWGSLVNIEGVTGDTKVSTSTTAVNIISHTGNLEVRTFSGDIAVSDLAGSPLLNSTKGDITLSFKTLPTEYPNILNSLNGNVTLYLEPSAEVSLRIRFDSGIRDLKRLNSEFSLQPLNPTSFPMGKDDRSCLYRSINGGGSAIYLNTFKGKIQILSL